MKRLLLISAIAISGLFYNTANAQIRLHVGVRLGGPIVVAASEPVAYQEPVTYNNDDYYYLPDVDAYYSVGQQCYYYNEGGNWVSAAYLPGAYRDYDWRSYRHFEIRAPRPYLHADFYRNRYSGAAFNGRWNNRVYNRGYVAANYHDNRGFGNGGYDNRRFENQRSDRDRRDNNHFDHNDSHGRGGHDWDDHRGR